MRRYYMVLVCAAALCCGISCKSGTAFPWGPPEPGPDAALVAGTVPAPQPITEPYPAPLRDGMWRMAGTDQFQSHRAGAQGPDSATEAWQFDCDGPLAGLGAASPDGSLYFIAGRVLYAVEPGGTIRARMPLATTGRVVSGPVMSADSTLYFGDSRGTLYAAETDGDILWQQAVSAAADHGIQQDGAGNLYTMDDNYRLTALSPAGAVLWRFDQHAAGTTFYHFDVASDGLVVLSYPGRKFAAVRDGELQWQTEASGGYMNVIWIGPDGLIYTLNIAQPSGDDTGSPAILEAYSAGGELLHIVELDIWSERLPSANSQAADGTLYVVGDDDRLLQVVSPGAASIQTLTLAHPVSQDVAVGPDAALYAIAGFTDPPQTRLCAFGPQGELRWSTALDSDYFLTRALDITSNGIRLLTSEDPYSSSGAQRLRLQYFSTSGELLLDYRAGAGEQAAPVCDAAGNIYLACGQQLYSISGEGALRWQVAQPGTDRPMLAVSPADDQLYVLDGSAGEYSYAESRLSAHSCASGELLWQITLPSHVWQPPLVGADGTILVGPVNWERQLLALNADGSTRWTYTDERYQDGRYCIDASGNIYLSSSWYDDTGDLHLDSAATRAASGIWRGRWLRSLGRNGALRWSVDLPSVPGGGPTVADDGSILVSDKLGTLYAFSADGRLLRKSTYGLPGRFGITLGQGGTLLLNGIENNEEEYGYPAGAVMLKVLAYDANLTQHWRSEVGPPTWDVAVADGAGRLYFSRGWQYGPGGLAALDSGGGLLFDLRLTTGGPEYTYPATPVLAPGSELLAPAGELLRAYGN